MSDADERLEKIETALMLLQQDVEEIHQSLTYQFERIQGIDQRFKGIERELELMQQPEEKRDPDIEKPPHY